MANNEVKKKSRDEAECLIDKKKQSYADLKQRIKDYDGEKMPAEKFNALSQNEKIKALKSMGDKVFAGCRRIHCLDLRHEDSNPSMGYDKEQHGFYCFACHRSCDLIDLVMEVYGYMKFTDAYAKCVELFVEPGGDVMYRYKPKFNSDGKSRKKGTYRKEPAGNAYKQEPKKEFLPKPMWATLQNEHYIHLQSLKGRVCDFALSTLAVRGLECGDVGEATAIAEKFHLRGWEYQCEYYLVFVNDDGSACRRYIGGAYSYHADERWWNTRGKVGIFNERALDSGDIVFVCEGCFDALTVMCFSPYQAVSINGLANLDGVLRRKGIKPILLTDNDEAGRKAALNAQKNTGFYVPYYLQEGFSGKTYIGRYKDISESASFQYKKLGTIIQNNPDFDMLRDELTALYKSAEKYYREQERRR